jgi:hypothetical protein
MATFVMQALGCDVSALNTVHFSMPFFFCAFPPFLIFFLVLSSLHFRVTQSFLLSIFFGFFVVL